VTNLCAPAGFIERHSGRARAPASRPYGSAAISVVLLHFARLRQVLPRIDDEIIAAATRLSRAGSFALLAGETAKFITRAPR